MIDSRLYKNEILASYIRACGIVHRDVLRELESRRSQVSKAPLGFLGIFPRKFRSRNHFLRVKMFLDYERINPTSDEELRTYILLLNDEYQKQKKTVKFKEPYNFIVQVPVTQWIRYKSQFFPKRRILPQILEDASHGKIWIAPRNPQARVPKKSRVRGYRDKGSALSEDTKARREANRQAANEEAERFLLRAALALAHRMRVQPTEDDYREAVRLVLQR